MVSEENVTDEPHVIIVYKTYTPALKKAQQKYYEANKQKNNRPQCKLLQR